MVDSCLLGLHMRQPQQWQAWAGRMKAPFLATTGLSSLFHTFPMRNAILKGIPIFRDMISPQPAALAIPSQSPSVDWHGHDFGWPLSLSGAVLPLKVSLHPAGLVPPSLGVFSNSKAIPGCDEDDEIASVYSLYLFVLLVPVHMKTADNKVWRAAPSANRMLQSYLWDWVSALSLRLTKSCKHEPIIIQFTYRSTHTGL